MINTITTEITLIYTNITLINAEITQKAGTADHRTLTQQIYTHHAQYYNQKDKTETAGSTRDGRPSHI